MMKKIEKKYYGLYVLIGVVGFLVSLFTAQVAVYTGKTIDAATNKSGQQLSTAIGLMIGFIVLFFAGQVLFDYLVNVSLKRMLHEIKTKVYHKLTDLTIADFSKQEQNFYLNMLTQDVNLLHDNYFLPKFTIW